MMLAVKPIVLHCVWNVLGAEHIRSNIYLAMQSHAVEEKFNNWLSQVLINESARRYFEIIHFYSTLTHTELSGRLQNTLKLMDLRCVNKDLQIKFLYYFYF